MHTVELLEEAMQFAQSLGFAIRQDWLSGSGGPCEIKGKRWLFVDLSLTHREQLDQVVAAIRMATESTTTVPEHLQGLVRAA